MGHESDLPAVSEEDDRVSGQVQVLHLAADHIMVGHRNLHHIAHALWIGERREPVRPFHKVDQRDGYRRRIRSSAERFLWTFSSRPRRLRQRCLRRTGQAPYSPRTHQRSPMSREAHGNEPERAVTRAIPLRLCRLTHIRSCVQARSACAAKPPPIIQVDQQTESRDWTGVAWS